MSLKFSFFIVLFIFLASPADGQILLFNNLSSGGATNVNSSASADSDALGGGTSVADGIVSLSQDSTISRVDFTGFYFGDPGAPAEDNFTISFLDGSSGSPGEALSNGVFNVGASGSRVDSGFDFTNALGEVEDIFSFSVPIDFFTVAAGDQFFVSIANDTSGFAGTFEAGVSTDEGDGFFGILNQSTVFPVADAGVDFQLFGTVFETSVPEPSSSALIGLMLTAGATRRRRKQIS